MKNANTITMNKKKYFHSFLAISLITSCLRNNLPIEGLPVIDVDKNYPEKEFLLTDIADITYVHLNSNSNEFLYKGTIGYITENTFVVKDGVSGSVLFFSKEGIPQSRFNRYGDGPEEYLSIIGNLIIYDETTDDVFIHTPSTNFIQVYSSQGIYKRKLLLPQDVKLSQMDFFDTQSLIVFDEGGRLYKAQPKTSEDHNDYPTYSIDSSFFLISKSDGQILDYIQMSASQTDLSFKTPNGNPMMMFFVSIVKHSEGFLLCNPETDTVFFYSKNKELTPIIHKTPLVNNMDTKIILNNCIDVDKYQFMEIQTVGYEYWGDNNRNKYYIRDKQKDEVYRQKIMLPDYIDKEIIIRPNGNNFFHNNSMHIELDLIELKQAYRENRLRGKLKELVTTLNEFEDNNVFAFIKFK